MVATEKRPHPEILLLQMGETSVGIRTQDQGKPVQLDWGSGVSVSLTQIYCQWCSKRNLYFWGMSNKKESAWELCEEFFKKIKEERDTDVKTLSENATQEACTIVTITRLFLSNCSFLLWFSTRSWPTYSKQKCMLGLRPQVKTFFAANRCGNEGIFSLWDVLII